MSAGSVRTVQSPQGYRDPECRPCMLQSTRAATKMNNSCGIVIECITGRASTRRYRCCPSDNDWTGSPASLRPARASSLRLMLSSQTPAEAEVSKSCAGPFTGRPKSYVPRGRRPNSAPFTASTPTPTRRGLAASCLSPAALRVEDQPFNCHGACHRHGLVTVTDTVTSASYIGGW